MFARQGPAWILVVMLVMVAVAGYEAVRRTSYRVPGLFAVAQVVMLTTSVAVTLYGVVGVLCVRHWYTPQNQVPMLGMILGTTLNGISLGLETVLDG